MAAFIVCALAAAATPLPAAVWPPPLSASCGGGPGPTISGSLQFALSGAGAASAIAAGATARYAPLLTEHAPAAAAAAAAIDTIAIDVLSGDETLGQATDYGYSMSYGTAAAAAAAAAPVTTVNVVAASPYAVAYALETLSQFIGNDGQLACSSLHVDDAPRFPHRGLMIDTGRRFYPVPLVKSTIEGLAMTKQNVLHFHLSEECFRVQSLLYPALTASCVSDGNNNTAFYTQAEVRDIVAFARLRGVRVVPEFDMPGHSGGFCTALASAGIVCCGSQIEDDAAGASARIIASILSEMSGLFPDRLLHLGCDETGSAAPCDANNTKSFEVKMQAHLLALGKTPMGWEEILFKTGAAAAFPMTIVDSWARESWAQAAAAGHEVVMSNYGKFYLDYPAHSAAAMWLNISALGGATAAQQQLLLGGETSMWQDQYVHSCLFDNAKDAAFTQSTAGCIWPRAAIAAGSFWGFYSTTKGLDDATFDATQQRLLARGVDSCPCATLNSTSCSQMSRCGVAYCPPTPSPPTPPTPPTPAPAACGSAAPWTCLFAVPCAASDPDQSIAFEDGQLKSASGLCADAVGCKQVDTLALAPCDASSKTQQWTHNATGSDKFRSVGCAGQCIDCYDGGRGNAGLYDCSAPSNQDWVAAGKTFSEDYRGLKCMSQAPPKPAAGDQAPPQQPERAISV